MTLVQLLLLHVHFSFLWNELRGAAMGQSDEDCNALNRRDSIFSCIDPYLENSKQIWLLFINLNWRQSLNGPKQNSIVL